MTKRELSGVTTVQESTGALDAPPAQASTRPSGKGPVASPRIEVFVDFENGQTAARNFLLDGDVLRIGSHESNQIVLSDPLVSRLHCQIRNHPLGWRIVDTGSLNGTRVAGVAVRDADLTLPECKIELGNSVLRVRTICSGGEAAAAPPAFGSLFGAAPTMRRMFDRLDRIAKAEGIDVLVEGESGTGKELIAAEIVRRSARAAKPFVIVDCGAISPTLVESELFGHAKGAFTGADRARVGAFEAAEGGTVFLDEIGELPLEMQPKLLRALANREVRRVGENQTRRVDVRVIAATNRRLEAEVNAGRFREDLYFRLSVLRVDVPPLRERLEDLPLLVGCFLEQMGVPERLSLFTSEVLQQMRRHTWPGNVRELRNYVERFVVFDEHLLEPPSRSETSSPPAPLRSSAPPPADDIDIDIPFRHAKERVVDDFERRFLTKLLVATQGNVSKAARKSKIDRMYLHRLLQRYGIRRSALLDD